MRDLYSLQSYKINLSTFCNIIVSAFNNGDGDNMGAFRVRLPWVAFYSAMSSILFIGLASAQPTTETPGHDSKEEQWFKDSNSGCKFTVPALNPPTEPGAGVWATAPNMETFWFGDCSEGMASGIGTAILSMKPVLPKGDFGHNIGWVKNWPPFENVFYGRFDNGRPNGHFIVRYSSGMAVVAEYKDGRLKGDPVVNVVGNEDVWMVLPQGQFEKMTMQRLRSDDLHPTSIDPRQSKRLENLRAQPKSDRNVAALFLIKYYSTEDDMNRSIAAAFPLLSNSSDLLGFLKRVSDDLRYIYFGGANSVRAGCRHSISLAYYPQTSWYCIYSDIKEVNGQKERWLYNALFSDDQTLLFYELHRFFEGSDFAAWGTPLNERNFQLGKDFFKVAIQLLGPNPSMEQVSSTMEGAGLQKHDGPPLTIEKKVACPTTPTKNMTPSCAFDNTDSLSIEPIHLVYIFDYSSFHYILTGCGPETGIDFQFDPVTKRFLKVSQFEGGACL